MTATGHKVALRGVRRVVAEVAGLAQTEAPDLAATTPATVAGFAELLVQTALLRPDRLVEPDAWVGHIPFAFWLMAAHRPRVLVELGTHTGNSYGAFCQAVTTFELSTACYAIDTWEGDPQAGYYGEEVYEELRRYHDARYAAFSRLVRSTFDEALDHFADGSIDLLHIDGYHTYDAVRHDFEAWRPKLSARGIVLFHDINVREGDFGAWRLWQEVAADRPHFAFHHSHGLGVLAVGDNMRDPARELCTAPDDYAVAVRSWFATAGWSVQRELSLARLYPIARVRDELAAALTEASRQRTELEAAVEAGTRHREELEAALLDAARQRAELEAAVEAEARHREELEAALLDAARQRAELEAAVEAEARHREELEAALLDAAHQRAELEAALGGVGLDRDQARQDAETALAQLRRIERARSHMETDYAAEIERAPQDRDLALAEVEELHKDRTLLLDTRGYLVRKVAKERRRRQRMRRSVSWRVTKPLRIIGSLFKRPASTPKKEQRPEAAKALPEPDRPLLPPPAPKDGPDSPGTRIRSLRRELDRKLARQSPPLPMPTDYTGDLPWLAQQRRTQFLALRHLPVAARIALVAHVHYGELWAELAAAIANLDEPFDLFVTLTTPDAEDLRETVLARWPQAHVLTVDNHGRDIIPFLSLLRTGVLFRYELVCKVHTKRSHWHPDGEAWRRDLIGGVLGSSTVVRNIVDGFNLDPALGMVVADGHLYCGQERWEGNRKHLTRLFPFLGMDDSQFSLAFAGGSIFWARPAFLRLISDLPLDPEDFEPEPLESDGALVHAIERLISLVCYEAGLTIKETSRVMK